MATKANNARSLVAALAISAAAFATWQNSEGFTDRAMIPTKGDVPTIGHGSTRYEDGQPVKMGDIITRERAVQLAHNLMSADERAFTASLPASAKLFQAEYDVYLDFVGQYGIDNWRKSSMRRHVEAGQYAAACEALLRYRFADGYDCSTPGNKRCWGVWERQLARHSACVAVQS